MKKYQQPGNMNLLEVIEFPVQHGDRYFSRKAFNRMCENIRAMYRAKPQRVRLQRSEYRRKSDGLRIQQVAVWNLELDCTESRANGFAP
jgi:hypothetical protein